MSPKSSTNVDGESDGREVPANCLNKDGRPSAEGREGRRPTKENIEQATASETQSWINASSGLLGVREVARREKQTRFTALLHHVAIPLLLDSFYALKRDAAPGVDGVTWKEYETDLDKRLLDLHNRVHRGTYRAQPSKRAYISKTDGRQRPLGIAALEDKIVQHSVMNDKGVRLRDELSRNRSQRLWRRQRRHRKFWRNTHFRADGRGRSRAHIAFR